MPSMSRFAAPMPFEPPPSNQRVKFFKEHARLRAATRPSSAELELRGTALANSADTRGGGVDALRESELPLPE